MSKVAESSGSKSSELATHTAYDARMHVAGIIVDEESCTSSSPSHDASKDCGWYSCDAPCHSTTIQIVIYMFVVSAITVMALSVVFYESNVPEKISSDHGIGMNETVQWESKGNNGLDLVVENALDDRWEPYFDEYIALWGNGEPDSLSLTTQRVSADSSCSPSFGRLKVCNDNYGLTDWKGMNLNLVKDGYIVFGVSKMNDFFLAQASDVEKKYTMCHELGHGFGLGHTDEDYHNADRGDCLDYTRSPKENLLPGTFNFEVLALLYGTVSPKLQDRDDRHARFLLDMPQEIIRNYATASHQIATSQYCKTGVCQEYLGDGYQLIAHKLLVD